jgi:hypothetical protein
MNAPAKSRRHRGTEALLMAALGLIASCGESSPPAGRDAGAELVMLRSSRVVELGLVRVGTTASRSLSVENTSPHRVTLRVLKKSCACITVEVDPDVLEPGQISTVYMATDVRPDVDAQVHGIEIEAIGIKSDGHSRRQLIAAAMSFQPDIPFAVYPAAMVIHATAGDSIERELHIVASSANEFAIFDLSTTLPGFDLRLAEGPAPRGVTAVLTLHGVAPSPGRHEARAVFNTDVSSNPLVHVPIVVVSISEWQADPPGLAVLVEGHFNRSTHDIRLRLATQRDVPSPSVAMIVPPIDGVRATVRSQDSPLSVVVDIDPSAVPAPNGTTNVRLLDADGRFVLAIPIVWISLHAEPAARQRDPSGG